MSSALKSVSLKCLSSVSTQMSVSMLVGITMVGLLPAHLARRETTIEVVRVRSVPLIEVLAAEHALRRSSPVREPVSDVAPPETKVQARATEVEQDASDTELRVSEDELRLGVIETGSLAPAHSGAPQAAINVTPACERSTKKAARGAAVTGCDKEPAIAKRKSSAPAKKAARQRKAAGA